MILFSCCKLRFKVWKKQFFLIVFLSQGKSHNLCDVIIHGAVHMFVHSSVGPLFFIMHIYQLIYKQVPIKNVHLSKEFMLKELLYRFKIGQLSRVFSVTFEK